MKTKNLFLVMILIMALTGCSFLQSHKIRGTWALQEVQIPSNSEYFPYVNYDLYQNISITDHSFEVWDSEYNLIERYAYAINNDSVLTLTSRGYRNFVIKEATKSQLILADEQTMNGYVLYVFVPFGEKDGSIKHTKHSLRLYNEEPVNPIVCRLSQSEIEQSKTPAAVAYNFVNAIYQSNSHAMLSYMTREVRDGFESQRIADGNQSYDPYFSEPGSKLNIKGWDPAIVSDGYEIAVLYVQDEGYDESGRAMKKVYVGCVPSSELNNVSFQDITRYGGTNVKVLVVQNKKKWQVVGFK